MRVLIVAQEMTNDGVGMVVKNLVNSLHKIPEIDLDIISTVDKDNIKDDFINDSIRIFYIERLRTAGYNNFRKTIMRVMSKEHYDVVHIHNDLITWIVAKCAKKCNIPVIVGHAHGQEAHMFSKNIMKLVKKPMQYLNRKYCNKWVGCSKESIHHMFGRDGIVIPNYVPDNQIQILSDEEIINKKKELNIDLDKTIIGYAGRLNSLKNAIFIPEIYKNEKMDDYQHVFCGGFYEETKNKFLEYGISDKAIFLGQRDDMNILYNLFDIYVCPSLSEGMSMSLIQSQMMGIPCVVSPGVPLINDLGLGYFIQCKSYDSNEWKKNIEKAKDIIGSKSIEEINAIMEKECIDEKSIIAKLINIYKSKY